LHFVCGAFDPAVQQRHGGLPETYVCRANAGGQPRGPPSAGSRFLTSSWVGCTGLRVVRCSRTARTDQQGSLRRPDRRLTERRPTRLGPTRAKWIGLMKYSLSPADSCDIERPTGTHMERPKLGIEISRMLQRPSLEFMGRNCLRPAMARAARTGPGRGT